MQKIKIAIIEDNKRYAESVKRYLGSKDRFDKPVLFYSISEFKRGDKIDNFDIIFLDINLPDGSGIDLIQFIKRYSPETEIIILTTFAEEEKLFSALRLGASGYITKGNTIRSIEDAVEEVLRGGAVISPDMAGRFLNYFNAGRREYPEIKKDIQFTDEEIEVIEILARGLTNREISETLKIRYRYVKTILSKIYKKFGTSSRSEVVRRSIEMGIIEI